MGRGRVRHRGRQHRPHQRSAARSNEVLPESKGTDILDEADIQFIINEFCELFGSGAQVQHFFIGDCETTEAEEQALREAEDAETQAITESDEKARREVEEAQARAIAEAAEIARKEAEEAEAKARAEADEQARRATQAAEATARAEAEVQARREAEEAGAKTIAEAEVKVRREAGEAATSPIAEAEAQARAGIGGDIGVDDPVGGLLRQWEAADVAISSGRACRCLTPERVPCTRCCLRCAGLVGSGAEANALHVGYHSTAGAADRAICDAHAVSHAAQS